MNILPQKSWHVRTKKNIERVRRDEEKAAEEEKEKQRRIALAEQEARTEFLRARAKNRTLTDGSRPSPSVDTQQPEGDVEAVSSQDLLPVTLRGNDIAIPGLGDRREHINFFKDIEDGLVKQGKNKEHQEEKRKEQEEFEKKIGLLTYLGQSSLGGQESAPWYVHKSEKKNKHGHKDEPAPESEEDKEMKLKLAMEEKRKQFMDPLSQMKRYIDEKKQGHKKLKDKERKYETSEKVRSTTSKSSNSSSSSSSSKKTIEQLRAERLEREKQERMRTQALLAQNASEKEGVKRNEKDSSSEDEREESRGVKRKYNSQYNPDFVRQPKSRRRKDFH